MNVSFVKKNGNSFFNCGKKHTIDYLKTTIKCTVLCALSLIHEQKLKFTLIREEQVETTWKLEFTSEAGKDQKGGNSVEESCSECERPPFPRGKVKVAQSCPTFCDPMDCAVPGILQAGILEWAAFPFPRGSSQPRDGTRVSRTAGRFFTS